MKRAHSPKRICLKILIFVTVALTVLISAQTMAFGWVRVEYPNNNNTLGGATPLSFFVGDVMKIKLTHSHAVNTPVTVKLLSDRPHVPVLTIANNEIPTRDKGGARNTYTFSWTVDASPGPYKILVTIPNSQDSDKSDKSFKIENPSNGSSGDGGQNEGAQTDMLAVLKTQPKSSEKKIPVIPRSPGKTAEKGDFQVLNPKNGAEFVISDTARSNRDPAPKLGIAIRVQSPEQTTIHFRIAKRLASRVQFATIKQWDSEMTVAPSGNSFNYEKIVLLSPAEYQLIVNPVDFGHDIIKFQILDNVTKQMKDRLKATATPSIILARKNVYQPHEKILFSVRGKTDMKPKVECFNRGRWNRQCPGDLRVRRSGDKYLLQPATPGKYRLRMGEVYSQVFEVSSIRSVGGKSAVPSTAPQSEAEKVTDDTKSVKTKKSMSPKIAPRLSLRKTTFTSPARVTLNVQSSPGFKITYVLQKMINGSFKDISSSKKPEFNIEAPGKYQARAHYDNGRFSNPVSFEVQKTKLVNRPAAVGTEQPSAKKQRKARAIKTIP